MKEWTADPDLELMSQDEELLLADGMYLDMILFILDTNIGHEYKRNLLMDVLCVIVYDNSVDDNPQRDDRLRQRVVDELNKRADKLKLADALIMDYIKEVVYPQLNISI